MFQFKILYYFIKGFFKPNFKNKVILHHYQMQKVERHLHWVKQNAPYYKKMQAIDFQNIMLTDKQIMMDNFDAINTKNISKIQALQVATNAETTRSFAQTLGGVTVGLSSGTSGNKGIFLATEAERAQWVAEVLRRVLPIKIGRQQRIAFFLRSNSTLYEAVRSSLFRFQFFDLARPIATLIHELNILQPDVLIAPPSVLLVIAQSIDNFIIDIKPSKVISVAEVLEQDVKVRLERSFLQIIHQVYQATEGFLGSTCRYGTLHLHEDLLLFEKNYIDASHTAFYPIITDFCRRTQPIVRYQLNDILHEKQDICPCGSVFTAISHIEGRSDDVLQFGEILIFPDFIRYAVLLAADGIFNFQVEQTADNTLIVRLQTSEDFEIIHQKVEENIQVLLQKNGVNNCTLIFETLHHTDFYNKFRRVKNSHK
jgi:putative adenylate-forming enzyme